MQHLTLLAAALAMPAGTPTDGGYFGHVININGVPHAVIWAPKAEGETSLAWHPQRRDVPEARSVNDSMANTVAMAEAVSPLANWARGLSIGGFTDWCIPARDVLELGYRMLKPTDEENACSFRDGDNASSFVPGFPYTEESPVQTSAVAFQDGGPEAFFESWYWSSTQYSASLAYYQYFGDGLQNDDYKSYGGRARAVRLIQLSA